jgi:hypothetical protein
MVTALLTKLEVFFTTWTSAAIYHCAFLIVVTAIVKLLLQWLYWLLTMQLLSLLTTDHPRFAVTVAKLTVRCYLIFLGAT